MNFENITSASDIILNGLMITVLGLMVVFAVLIIIMLFIYAMTAFSKGKNGAKAEQKQESQVIEAVEEEPRQDESELIAVITAAVAACMGRSASGICVKSYKKVSSAWSGAAKNDILNRF